MPPKFCSAEELLARVAASLPPGWQREREFRGLCPEAFPFFCGLLAREFKRRLWILCTGPRERDELAGELTVWAPGARALPSAPSQEGVLDPEAAAARLDLLGALADPGFRGPVVVETAQLEERVPRPEDWAAGRLRLERGMRLEPRELLERLAAAGYERAPQTSLRGEFTPRGGLADVFSHHAAEPLRIEWDDDRIASLRFFDPDTQLSVGETESAELALPPAHSRLVPLRELMEGSQVAVAAPGVHWPGAWELKEGLEGPPALLSLPFGELHAGELVLDEHRARRVFDRLEAWREAGWRVVLAAGSEGERARFREFAAERSREVSWIEWLDAPVSQGFAAPEARLALLSAAALFGRAAALRLSRAAARARRAGTRAAVDFSDFAEGDLVVHLEYGIGIFRGSRPSPDNPTAEELVIEYAGGALLGVPLHEAWQISRYAGVGRARPALSQLGSGAWEKAREKAVRSVFEYAGRMLRVQAEREALAGYAFGPDTHWQKEFEDAFPWRETPDQLRAIAEAKADMESPRPMDRLVCGDVGFGKTEVAIRAAFKAVMGGKQVAFLAPTTVLARQHFYTLRTRMGDFPVTVELLSRLRTPAEQRRVLEGLASGAVDIVVGTHRLISPDVVFRDLGLVVVDEEQRFGVRQKDALKERFRQVDILTLSATPIPRTLYLALAGARDLSLIETPPPNRQSVETILCAYDERVWRAAIEAELARGGQVYFLHNRVRTIERLAARVRELCPGARVVVGHGQMGEAELDAVMGAFAEGHADVLVATTIIESGLDIPNANTIIIDRADLFGLADLYQLRGRVGRSGVKARAYLMLPRDLMGAARRRVSAIKQYSELGSGFKIAMRDLELRGAGNLLGTAQSGHIHAVGFDLYCKLLRQAVETLKTGKRFRRLTCAVRLDFVERAAEAPAGKAAAGLPDSYIASLRERIACHRQLAEAETLEDIETLEKQWADRFGPPPPAAQNLLLLARLACLGATRGLAAIESQGERVMLLWRRGGYWQPGGRFPRLTAADPDSRLRETFSLVDTLPVE